MEKSKLKMFEKIIQEKMRDFEAENNPNDWAGFEQKYDAALKKAKLISRLKVFSVATALIVSTVLLYNVIDNQVSKQQLDNLPVENETEIIYTVSEDEKETFEGADINTNVAETFTKQSFTKPVQEKPKSIVLKDADDNTPTIVAEPQIEKQLELADKTQKKQDNEIETILYNLFVESGKNAVCVGEEIHFSPSIINNSYTYNWDFGNEMKSKELFPKIAFSEAGTYEIKLAINSGTNKEQTAYHTVTIYAAPDAVFDYEITKETFGYPRVKFIDKTTDATQWKWSFGDSRFSYEQHPYHVYFTTENIVYDVLLSVENIYGCKHEYMTQVAFDDMFDLMAPNAFSPDGDGLNDYFIPRALEMMDIPFEMFIYDRAGTMVYNTKNKSKPWDGRIGTSGIIPESGTFIWIVLLYDSNGKSYKYAGTVSIVK